MLASTYKSYNKIRFKKRFPVQILIFDFQRSQSKLNFEDVC